jgi:maltose/moltooligosaccharide transporter
VAASIGLFVSMVCLVLLLAKLIKSIALSVWNTTPKDMKLYDAVSWTGLVNGWYNIVTFLCAFGLVYFARKYSPKMVHFTCLLLAAVGFNISTY